MPELPEVETVKDALKIKVLNKKIKNVKVYYDPIIENIDVNSFIESIKRQTIVNIKRRGKWLIFELNDFYLFSHLRMEGKYTIRNKNDNLNKHEHVVFIFTDDTELRYMDTRKFGKMQLVKKEEVFTNSPLTTLGLEPWDDKLDKYYLYSKFKNKSTAIKTVLLDQTIIAGIGNIYANEILYLAGINPQKKAKDLSEKELNSLIDSTRKIMESAIKLGGTTIRTFSSSEGVHGRFQQILNVHDRKGSKCKKCGNIIQKIVINGRSTFYCEKCQKM